MRFGIKHDVREWKNIVLGKEQVQVLECFGLLFQMSMIPTRASAD
jgi:hypothetical protein